MAAIEKRRSDRLMLTIPLRAHGHDVQGQAFESSARTVDLNRYGARARVLHPLRAGQHVRLVNLVSQRGADFRVVRSLSSSPEKGGDYGMECLDDHENIWQIQFPSPTDGEAADAKALLECGMCHTRALTYLSVGELEILRTAGVVAKRCQTCDADSPWKYAEMRTGMEGTADKRSLVASERTPQPRRHRRVCLQLPLGVRDSQGGAEVTRTENVSRGGFCFTSEKDYPGGPGVRVVFPGDAVSREIEIPVRIVWRQTIEGTNRKVYGVHCERPGEHLEAASAGTGSL